MPLRRRRRAEPQGTPRCEGKGAALLEQAFERSHRGGGTASVVDPLLSLLIDLRRLEEQIIDTLSLLGVDTDALCVPVTKPCAAAAAAASAPIEEKGVATAVAQVAQQPTSTAPLSTPPSTAPAASASLRNPLQSYCARAAAFATNCAPTAGDYATAQTQANVVEGVLRWLDAQYPISSDKHVSIDAADSSARNSDSARHLLANWVACGVSGSGAALLTPMHDDETDRRHALLHPPSLCTSATATHPHRKRQRTEVAAVSWLGTLDSEPLPPPAGKALAEIRSLGAYTARELTDMVQVWRHYKRGLSIAAHEAGELLHALCTPKLGASLSTHAKWTEVTAADKKRPFHLPSCASLMTNYEEILNIHDCFASCQRPVHASFVSLEGHIDTLCEEALVVSGRDREFWQRARCFQAEYAALHAIKSQTARIIASIKPLAKGENL